MIKKQELLSTEDESFFRTFDLGLTAALVALEETIDAIDKGPRSNKAEFVFKRTVSLEQIVAEYWDYDLAIEPQSYFNALKAVKNRLYSS